MAETTETTPQTLRQECVEQTQWLGGDPDFKTYIPRHIKLGRKKTPIDESYADAPLVPVPDRKNTYAITNAAGVTVYAYLSGNSIRVWSETVTDFDKIKP